MIQINFYRRCNGDRPKLLEVWQTERDFTFWLAHAKALGLKQPLDPKWIQSGVFHIIGG